MTKIFNVIFIEFDFKNKNYNVSPRSFVLALFLLITGHLKDIFDIV